MEFVTIHDLFRELNVPARVIRYRLIHLIADAKLKERDDFRRDDFRDDQHFVWKIRPLRFMQETGLKPTVTSPLPADNKVDNRSLPTVDQIGNTHATSSVEPPKIVTQFDNDAGNKTNDQSLAREMIDLLKGQLQVKDQQLQEQGEQIKETHELNLKLTGTMLQQSQKIENLPRLGEHASLLSLRLTQPEDGPTLQPWLVRAMAIRETGIMVGHIGSHTAPCADYLRPFSPEGVEFGYTVFPAYRRQGYAREAAIALMNWSHLSHAVKKFVMSVRPDNIPSQCLAAQLGFVRIGSHIDEVDGLEEILERSFASSDAEAWATGGHRAPVASERPRGPGR
jgi:[ribosomal protein S5]-alanine N-acetyltransferase